MERLKYHKSFMYGVPSVRVNKNTYDRLLKLTCKLTARRGRRQTFNDVIRYLLDRFEERGDLREGI